MTTHHVHHVDRIAFDVEERPPLINIYAAAIMELIRDHPGTGRVLALADEAPPEIEGDSYTRWLWRSYFWEAAAAVREGDDATAREALGRMRELIGGTA